MTPAQIPPVAESVEVTQADREAARFAVECVTDSPPKARPEFADLWEDDLTRAFARHRLASYEAGRAEGAREAAGGWSAGRDAALSEVADMARRSPHLVHALFVPAIEGVAHTLHLNKPELLRALSKEPTK